jgi:hypothetical protein
MATAATKPSFGHDHKFYLGAALVFALVVFVGLAPTFYLKRFFDNSPLPLLVHIHGFVMTLWYALFITQVLLVAKDRVGLHQKLGFAGFFLSAAVAVLGTAVSLGLARHRLLANANSTLGPFLLCLQLFSIVLVFVILISFAVYFRRRPDYHKRLMTLAMLTVLGPAIVRLPGINDHNIPAAIVIGISLTLTCIIIDTVRHKRLHPALAGAERSSSAPSFFLSPSLNLPSGLTSSAVC